MAADVGTGSSQVCGSVQAIGGVPGLFGVFIPEVRIDSDLDVLARSEGDRAHLVVGRVMTPAAVGKTITGDSLCVDVVQYRVSTAAAWIVLGPGAGPVVGGAGESG